MPLRVPLQFVKPTMRLAGPIVDTDGRLVAGTGTELRDSVVRVLRKMAVQAVLVAETDEVGAFETIKPLAEELRALEERLPRSTSTGPLAELRAAIARHLTARAERLGRDPEP
jgi:hypothetical protein